MTVPAAPSADFPSADLLLDACSALRADLAARDAAAPQAPAADAPPAPPNVEAVAAWLPLVVAVERSAQLPARQRAAHFRQTRPAWDAAAAACDEPRYAALGARLARWRAPDPRLPIVREILWAFEQPEAAGYTHLALAGYTALGRLLPGDDVRQGYMLAQSARALRTLGEVDAATERYHLSERLGVTHRDRWLRVRSAIGLGASYHHSGKYPAARAVFRRVLASKSPDARFTVAAHHGFVLSAIAAKDWDAALAHGWHLLQAGRQGLMPRAEVLLLLASVCRSTGRYPAAARAAQAALALRSRPTDCVLASKIIVDAALGADDKALALTYSHQLRAHLNTGAGPFEDSRALLSLAAFEEKWGDHSSAVRDAARAELMARSHGFNELTYSAGLLLDRLRANPHQVRGSTPSEARATGEAAQAAWDGAITVVLRNASLRIIDQLSDLPIVSSAELVTA